MLPEIEFKIQLHFTSEFYHEMYLQLLFISTPKKDLCIDVWAFEASVLTFQIILLKSSNNQLVSSEQSELDNKAWGCDSQVHIQWMWETYLILWQT